MDQEPESNSTKWVTIAHFPTTSNASVAQTFLESRNIPVNLKNAMFQYTLNFSPKQIRLQVPDEYVEEAHALLVEGEFIKISDSIDDQEEGGNSGKEKSFNPIFIILGLIVLVGITNYFVERNYNPQYRMTHDKVVVETIIYQGNVEYSDSIWEAHEPGVHLKIDPNSAFGQSYKDAPKGIVLKFLDENKNQLVVSGKYAQEFPFEGTWLFNKDSLYITENAEYKNRLYGKTDLMFMGAYKVEIKGNRFLMSSEKTLIDGYFVK